MCIKEKMLMKKISMQNLFGKSFIRFFLHFNFDDEFDHQIQQLLLMSLFKKCPYVLFQFI